MLKIETWKYWQSRNKLRISSRLVMLVLMCCVLIIGAGCENDEKEFPTIDPEPVDGEFSQYGTPFDNVPATSDIAMYEVNLRAFSANGDLQGVTSKLDHLQDLGINVVWLMPIYPTGILNGVGSPYAIRDYMQVKPEFGTLNSLRALVEEAHERDMAVILDWVGNHTAWDHPWIEENPEWYTQDSEGNIISPQEFDWTDVADLNYSNADMRAEMIKSMKYWVLEANVDGFRVDYAAGVPTTFWNEAIDELRAIPDRDIIMFAEAAEKEMFTAGFDLIFGWYFYSRLEELFNDNLSATSIITANNVDYNNVPDGSHILRWITNHDDNAWEDTPQNIFNGQDGAIAAFVVTSYMGGVPLIYNGQEIGYPNQIGFFEGTVTPIDWSLNPQILTEYQQLMAFRNSSAAVKGGELETFPSQDVVAFKRISGSEEVLVLVNIRETAVDFELPAPLANTEWEDAITNSAVSLNTTVSMAAHSYIILKN